MTDRVTGAVLLLVAAVYGFAAWNLETGFGSGVLTPKDFPLLLAGALGAVALGIIFKPDPDAELPGARSWLNLAAISLSFVAYAYLIVPLGFILATALETGFVSQRFGAKLWQAALTGAVVSLAMYVLFVYALGIPLPLGRLFGGR